MKKYNIIKVVLVTILILVFLTWLLPAASFSSEYTEQGRIQMGLFDLFNYPITALSYFGYISLYIIMIGGFYGILYKIPAYRTLLDKISSSFAKKSKVVIPIMILLIAVLVSVCGLQLGLLLFFPFIASIILLMGYDKIVVALTLAGSTAVGLAGTTYAYSNVSILNSLLQTELNDNMGVKVLVLVLGLALLIINTLMYMKKSGIVKREEKIVEKIEVKVDEVEIEQDDMELEEDVEEEPEEKEEKKTSQKKSTNNSKTSKSKTTKKSTGKKSTSKKKSSKSSKNNKAAITGEEVIVVKNVKDDDDYLVPHGDNDKHSILPIICSLLGMFVILVLAFVPWTNAFQITAMQDATSAVVNFQIFKFPIFSKILGTFHTFGDWMITDMIVVMVIVTLLLYIIYNMKINDVFDGFVAGAKKALAPAFIALLAYTVLVITTYHPFQLTIYKAILSLTDGFNVFTSTFVVVLSTIFNSDPAYVFQSTIPYLSSLVSDKEVYPIIEILFQSVYGFSMLFSPTSLVLMATLAYLGVSYKEWLKAIWKLLVEFLVLLLILFTILTLI